MLYALDLNSLAGSGSGYVHSLGGRLALCFVSTLVFLFFVSRLVLLVLILVDFFFLT